MSVSARLEQLDPSSQYRDGLDAFQRQLEVAGIGVMSDIDWGIASDTWDDFCKDANTRALAYEWAIRTAKRVGGRNPNTRALYASTDQPIGGVVEPFVNAAQARVQQIDADPGRRVPGLLPDLVDSAAAVQPGGPGRGDPPLAAHRR
jgi:hypothetical protein